MTEKAFYALLILWAWSALWALDSVYAAWREDRHSRGSD